MIRFSLPFLWGYALAGEVDDRDRLLFLRLVEGARFVPPSPAPSWWDRFENAVASYREAHPADFRFVPLALERVSPYARKVLHVLRERVRWGETVTYGALARMAGGSPRAVGQAMRHNPWVVVVPCHRVLAHRGLGGYAYGVEIKAKLLELERGVPPKTGGA